MGFYSFQFEQLNKMNDIYLVDIEIIVLVCNFNISLS